MREAEEGRLKGRGTEGERRRVCSGEEGCLGRNNLRRWEQTLESPRWERNERSHGRTREPHPSEQRYWGDFVNEFRRLSQHSIPHTSHCFTVNQGLKVRVCSDSVAGSHRTLLAEGQGKMGVLIGSPQILMYDFCPFRSRAVCLHEAVYRMETKRLQKSECTCCKCSRL